VVYRISVRRACCSECGIGDALLADFILGHRLDSATAVGAEAGQLPIEPVVSAITMAELAAGPHATVDADERARQQDRLPRAEAAFDPLPFDGEAARAYGRIYSAEIASGRKARAGGVPAAFSAREQAIRTTWPPRSSRLRSPLVEAGCFGRSFAATRASLTGQLDYGHADRFILTNLDWEVVEIEAWFSMPASVEENVKDAKLGAALRHLPPVLRR